MPGCSYWRGHLEHTQRDQDGRQGPATHHRRAESSRAGGSALTPPVLGEATNRHATQGNLALVGVPQLRGAGVDQQDAPSAVQRVSSLVLSVFTVVLSEFTVA